MTFKQFLPLNRISNCVFISAFILISLFFISCQKERTLSWKPPTFVTEWDIKEIHPSLSHEIVSLTANKNGIYALIVAVEVKYIAPKKTNKMTKKELEFEEFFFGRILNDKERKSKKIGTRIENKYYYIQHYDLDGEFISQWPEKNKLILPNNLRSKTDVIIVGHFDSVSKELIDIDSREYLINPLEMVSDHSNNIYIADYDGNKIVKFDSKGNVLNLWRIERSKDMDRYYKDPISHRGLSVLNDKLYVISEGFENNTGAVPRISIYNLNGKLLSENNLAIPMVPAMNPYEFPVKRIPFKNIEGKINDIAVDSDGSMYLLAGMVNVIKYDKNFKKVKSFEPILKKGFDMDVKVYNPETGRYQRFARPRTKNFNSQKGSGFGLDLRYYDIDGLYFPSGDELYVTFIGQKPFGAINSLIYNKNGEMFAYWKVKDKSYSDWYRALTDIEKIKSKERKMNVTFHEESIYVGKTISYRKGDILESDRGPLVTSSLIQRFDKK